MDNKPMELKAKNEISKQLLKLDLLVADPFFDKLGSDLLVISQIQNVTNLTVVQCKGRLIKSSNNSNVRINEKYVNDGFILFLYLEIEDSPLVDFLYCFLKEDIELWNKKEEFFTLSISKGFKTSKIFIDAEYSLNSNMPKRVKEICTSNDLNLYDILRTSRMISQVEINWRVHKLKPSLEQMEKIFGETEFNQASIDQIIFVFINNLNYSIDVEEDFTSYPNTNTFKLIHDRIISESEKSIQSIYEKFKVLRIAHNKFGISNWYETISDFVIIEGEFEVNDIVSHGMYCYLVDDERNGIELLVCTNDKIKSLIKYHDKSGFDISEIIEKRFFLLKEF